MFHSLKKIRDSELGKCRLHRNGFQPETVIKVPYKKSVKAIVCACVKYKIKLSMGMNPIWFYYFSCRSGEGDSHTTTQSDLDGPAIQLNPVLIQTPTPCVPLALLCRLNVQQHKANPGFTQSGNEIRCSGANVFRLCSASSGRNLEELGSHKSVQDFNYLFKRVLVFCRIFRVIIRFIKNIILKGTFILIMIYNNIKHTII